MDNVGQHMQGAEIWTEFIDFEMALNHMSFVNLLGYMAVKTPLLNSDKIEARYARLFKHFRYLDIVDTLYDTMVEQMNAPGFTVGDKYQAKYDELGKNTTKDPSSPFSLRFNFSRV